MNTALHAIQVMTDVVILGLNPDYELMVCLVKREATQEEPNKWSIPGVIVSAQDEDTRAAANRAIEKTGLSINYLEEFGWSSGQKRDPRGWSVSLVYMCLVKMSDLSEGAQWIKWSDIDGLDFAFDHKSILQRVSSRLKDKVNYSSLPVFFMEELFTLPQLQKVYEHILNVKLKDKAQFRDKIFSFDLIEEVPGELTSGRGRPAQKYRIKQEKRDQLVLMNKNLIG